MLTSRRGAAEEYDFQRLQDQVHLIQG